MTRTASSPAARAARACALLALLLLCLAAPATAAPRRATPPDKDAMRFRVIVDPALRHGVQEVPSGGEPIFAKGTITEGTAARFRAFVRAKGIKTATVYLESPGGSLEEGIELGRAIREHGFNTDVGAQRRHVSDEANESVCASACSYAYAGGVGRFLTARSGKLGLHQFSSGHAHRRANEGDTQLASAMIVDYLAEMGVDARVFSVATMADPDAIVWLTPEDALDLGIANNGNEPTMAEIGLYEMKPYLFVQQTHRDMLTRAMFFCLEGRLVLDASLIVTPALATRWTTGLGRAWIELDGKEDLITHGADAASAAKDLISFSREITPAMARRLLEAKELAIFVQSPPGAPRGDRMDLRTAHEKMLAFFRQCLAAGLPDPSPNHPRDLVVTSTTRGDDFRSTMMLDRNSLIRKGEMMRGWAYAAGIDREGQGITASLTEFDCAGDRSREVTLEIHDLDGKLLSTTAQDWQHFPPNSGGDRLRRTACGVLRPDAKYLLGDVDPYPVLRTFLEESAFPAPPKSRGKGGK